MRNPKKHNYSFCVASNKEMLLDNQESIYFVQIVVYVSTIQYM